MNRFAFIDNRLKADEQRIARLLLRAFNVKEKSHNMWREFLQVMR
jgi:hypothetical protein